MKRLLVGFISLILTLVMIFGLVRSEDHVAAENEKEVFEYEVYHNNDEDVVVDGETLPVMKAVSSTEDSENLVEPNIIFMRGTTLENRFLTEEAAEAAEKLFDAAAEEGLHLRGVCGYKPGDSENQTGRVLDVSSEEMKGELSSAFADTPEGKWIKKHCEKYGFIVRYEPWQLRFVGKKHVAEY